MSTIDIFGGSRGSSSGAFKGPRGPRGIQGERGVSGIQTLCIWMPHTILQNYRENEEYMCLLIRDLDRDLVVKPDDGSVSKWKSRCVSDHHRRDNMDAVSKLSPSKTIIPLHTDGRYALEFKNNVYTCEMANFFPSARISSYVNILVSFKTHGLHNRQVLVSSYRPSQDFIKQYREIAVDATGIFIQDVLEDEIITTPIQCDTRKWMTLMVEWYHDGFGSKEKGKGKYTLLYDDGTQTIQGEFKCTLPPKNKVVSGLSLGGRYNQTMTLTGVIASFEMYQMFNNKSQTKDFLPTTLRSLLIKDSSVKDKY